jgi:hypothetical protein
LDGNWPYDGLSGEGTFNEIAVEVRVIREEYNVAAAENGINRSMTDSNE